MKQIPSEAQLLSYKVRSETSDIFSDSPEHGEGTPEHRAVEIGIPALSLAHNLAWLVYFLWKYYCKPNTRRMPKRYLISLTAIFASHSAFCAVVTWLNSQIAHPGCGFAIGIEAVLLSILKCTVYVFFSFRVDSVFRDTFLRYDAQLLWYLRTGIVIATLSFCIIFSVSVRNNKGKSDDGHFFCRLSTNPEWIPYLAVAGDFVFSMILIGIFAGKIYKISMIVNKDTSDGEVMHGGTPSLLLMLAKSEQKTRKLALSMQLHTTLFASYIFFSGFCLLLADWLPMSALFLCFNTVINLYLVWGVFKKRLFHRLCGPLLRSFCCQPMWKLCIRNYDLLVLRSSETSYIYIPNSSPVLSRVAHGTHSTDSARTENTYISPNLDRLLSSRGAEMTSQLTPFQKRNPLATSLDTYRDRGGSELKPGYLFTEYQMSLGSGNSSPYPQRGGY